MGHTPSITTSPQGPVETFCNRIQYYFCSEMYEYSHQLGQMKITNHFTSIQVRFYCQMSYKNLSIFRVCSILRFKIRESGPVVYSNSLLLTSGSKTITFISPATPPNMASLAFHNIHLPNLQDSLEHRV